MQRTRRSAIGVLAGVLPAVFAAAAHGSGADHLQCWRVRDPLRVAATVNIDTSRLGVHVGCRMSKARLFCAPASKAVTSSEVPILPIDGPPLVDGRICYRIRCQERPAPQLVSDQFGGHQLQNPRPTLLCTPAIQGPPVASETEVDQLLCYRAQSSVRVAARVDLDAGPVGQASGCRVASPRFHCVPVSSTVLASNVYPFPIGGSVPDVERICYKLRCARPSPADQTVADTFGGRTLADLRARTLCTPAIEGPPPPPTTTSTTVPGVTTTSTTLPAGTDPPLLCQRAIEDAGMHYADAVLDVIADCTAPTWPGTVDSCLASPGMQARRAAARADWGARVGNVCDAVDLHGTLGYPRTCPVDPSACQLPSDGTGLDGLLDCLACQVERTFAAAAGSLFANDPPTHPCHAAIGTEGFRRLRVELQSLAGCLTQPGSTSIAACFPSGPDLQAWRQGAIAACGSTDPFAAFGYRRLCSGVSPATPAACPTSVPACTFASMSALDDASEDDDLLGCLACQIEEALLEVTRTLHGANLCCAGGRCDTVRTRFSCRQVGGAPVQYVVDRNIDPTVIAAHGIDVTADGTLYVGGSGGVVKISPAGHVSQIGTTGSFPTGVAADAAGNVYVTNRCDHRIFKIAPSGAVTTFAGTGTAGSSGDGGPAVAARIVAPEGIAVDAAGNVYFTESGLLGIGCGAAGGNTERIRVVDPTGVIHTLVGSRFGALFEMPYGLHFGPDGTLLVGEAFAHRVFAVDVASGGVRHVAGRRLRLLGSYSGSGGPALRARFYQNCGVDADPDGNLVIASMDINRILLVDRLGSAIAIAGHGGGPGAPPVGTPAIQAAVGCPEDVAVGPDGRVYSSNLTTSRIMVLERAPF
jgi:streptogramin lyase